VVVASIQMRTLKTEARKGFVSTAVEHELVGPEGWGNSGDDPEGGRQLPPNESDPGPILKGKGVNIPPPGDWVAGQPINLRDADFTPR